MVSHASEYCTNASPDLSAIAEFLVLYRLHGVNNNCWNAPYSVQQATTAQLLCYDIIFRSVSDSPLSSAVCYRCLISKIFTNLFNSHTYTFTLRNGTPRRRSCN